MMKFNGFSFFFFQNFFGKKLTYRIFRNVADIWIAFTLFIGPVSYRSLKISLNDFTD